MTADLSLGRDAVAIVTGASRGIGRITALELAKAGVNIVCAARSTAAAPAKLPGTIDATAEEIRASGRRALAVACDVSREEDVAALVDRTLAEFGRIDVLVNNAAVNSVAPVADMTMKRFDLVMSVNLRGAVLCAKAVIPQMRRQGGGRIINVSSGAAVMPAVSAEVGIIPYAVSKAALECFTQALGSELKPLNIAVNGLRIEMPVVTEGAIFFNPGEDYSAWERPETVAEAIIWLAGREPSFTGEVLTVAAARAAMGRAR